MPEKLLTQSEAAAYLGITEEEVVALTKKGDLPAYRIGGAFLRFRREQLDAIRREVLPRRKEKPVSPAQHSRREEAHAAGSFSEALADFFYFKDFYIVSACLVIILLFVIFKY